MTMCPKRTVLDADMTVKVKICGLTRAADVTAAVDAGADALGFVFAASPRQVDAETAARLAGLVPAGILRIGLFLDAPEATIRSVLEQVQLDMIQFHGSEPHEACVRYGLPFLKAVSMLDNDPAAMATAYPDADGILLDSHAPGGAGGTGQTFDWRQRVDSDKPLWLAGGLNPSNVGQAVQELRPYAVDVSSGVEASPGVKDPDRIRRFIHNARQAAQSRQIQ